MILIDSGDYLYPGRKGTQTSRGWDQRSSSPGAAGAAAAAARCSARTSSRGSAIPSRPSARHTGRSAAGLREVKNVSSGGEKGKPHPPRPPPPHSAARPKDGGGARPPRGGRREGVRTAPAGRGGHGGGGARGRSGADPAQPQAALPGSALRTEPWPPRHQPQRPPHRASAVLSGREKRGWQRLRVPSVSLPCPLSCAAPRGKIKL